MYHDLSLSEHEREREKEEKDQVKISLELIDETCITASYISMAKEKKNLFIRIMSYVCRNASAMSERWTILSRLKCKLRDQSFTAQRRDALQLFCYALYCIPFLL